MDHAIFSDLNLTSRDSKVLVPALITFLKNFEAKFDGIFKEMKEDFQTKIEERDAKISELSTEVKTLKDRVVKMEQLTDDADAYERRDTLILSGDKVPAFSVGENSSHLVQNLVKEELKINLPADGISTAHRLGRKPANQGVDRRSFIVKLVRRDLKHEIISASKKLPKTTKLYVSESLTPARRTLFYALRKMKQAKMIKGCNTYEGRFYAYTAPSGSSQRDQRHLISNYEAWQEFCRVHVRQPLDNFLDSWDH